MSGLLHNARRFLQALGPAQPAQPQRFSVPCPDGHRLTGLRTDGYQSLRCPTCGEGIFVLPKSLLPEPAAPPTSAQVGNDRSTLPSGFDDDLPVPLTDPLPATVSHEPADAEIEWVDEQQDVEAPVVAKAVPERVAIKEPPARPTPGEAAPVRAPTPKKRPHPAKVPAVAAPVPIVEPPKPRRSLAESVRRHRTPLVAVAVLGVIAATVAIRSWRARQQELPRVAELGRVEGLRALDEGKFDRAYQLLSEAKHAVIALGDAYQGASAIKQGADEAAIINQLSPESLENLLDEAARSDPKDWSRRFDSLYKGRSVILDTQFTAVPNTLGEGRYQLDYQIVPPGGDGGPPRSVGEIDTQGFTLLDTIKPRAGDTMIFGARLASFRFDGERERWLVGLEPESGVIMTHIKALEALGWRSATDLTPEDQP